MSKKKHVTIEVYNDEGVMHESIGGPMDFEDIRATMISALKNDGIPVLRCYARHAAKDEPREEAGKHAAKPVQPDPATILSVAITCDNMRFSATGVYEDVMDAQAEFLRTILEQE